MSWSEMLRMTLDGMAKPIPIEPSNGDRIAVFMPMTLPFVLAMGAGIAGVDRRVGLDELVVRAVANVTPHG